MKNKPIKAISLLSALLMMLSSSGTVFADLPEGYENYSANPMTQYILRNQDRFREISDMANDPDKYKPAQEKSTFETDVGKVTGDYVSDKAKDTVKELVTKGAAKIIANPVEKKLEAAVAQANTKFSVNKKLSKTVQKRYVKKMKGIRAAGRAESKTLEKTLAGRYKVVNGISKGIGFIYAVLDAKDMYDNETVGYDSPFFEFCANSTRGMSGAASALSAYHPAGLLIEAPFLVAKEVVTSKTMINFVNDSGVKSENADDFIAALDTLMQDSIKYWFFFDDWEYAERMEYENEVQRRLLDEMKNRCNDRCCTANRISVYKPNIYLYPEDETDFILKFEEPSLLSVTDPIYSDSWSGIAYPDGKLTVNGRDCGFLFYESKTEPGYYQLDTGFVIPAEGRKEAFEEILYAYGLNGTEVKDFTDFWCEKLEPGVPYAMYPQMNEVIDRAMPISLTPEAESSLRIWFAFVPDDEPEQRATAEPFVREGFSLVEWGGFFMSK